MKGFYIHDQDWNESYRKGEWDYLLTDANEQKRFFTLAQKIDQDLFSEGSVLDIGCGNAGLLKFLSKSYSYLGLDISDYVLSGNSDKYSSYPNINFSFEDLTREVKFLGKFSCIILSEILYYLDKKKFLTLIENVKLNLKKNGLVYVSICKSDRADILPSNYYWTQMSKNFEIKENVSIKTDSYEWILKTFK